jgi:hypothetical protein
MRSITPFTLEDFDWFCRHVLNKLATFYVATSDGSRQTAGEHLLKRREAVGKSIRSIEQALKEWYPDILLLDRTYRKTIIPKEAGRAMVRFAGDIRKRSEQFLDELNRIENDGEVRVASIYSSWETYGAQLEAEFKARMPNGSVTVEFFNDTDYVEQITAAVRDGRADLGITSYPPIEKKISPLTVLPLIAQEMMLVFPSGYKKLPSGKEPIRLMDVLFKDKDLKFVIYTRAIDIPANRKVINYLHDCGVGLKPERKVEGETIRHIKKELVPGRLSILPASAVRNEVSADIFKAYSLEPPLEKWPWGIICYPLKYSRPSIRRFVEGFALLREKV